MIIDKATFGGGCFWCTEAIFKIVNGVTAVTSGYSGGQNPNPTYEQICSGTTGHAEVVEVAFDADVVSFEDLLLIFFKTHDATTLNRQGNDEGTQYRSVIFYHNNQQKQQAETMIGHLTAEQVFDKPIVTEISPATDFFKAEDHHQNYFDNHPLKPYCTFIIKPKLNRFARQFNSKMKPELL